MLACENYSFTIDLMMGETVFEGEESSNAYSIVLDGGREHGHFDIVPPTSDQHYSALMQEPRLSWAKDFYLARGNYKDSFWLGGDYRNGSGYGEHYERAAYFAAVVAQVLQGEGAECSLVNDARFEHKSALRLQRIQELNRRTELGI